MKNPTSYFIKLTFACATLGLSACTSTAPQTSSKLTSAHFVDDVTFRTKDWIKTGSVDTAAISAHIKQVDKDVYKVTLNVEPDVWNGTTTMFDTPFGYNKSNLSLFYVCVANYVTLSSNNQYFKSTVEKNASTLLTNPFDFYLLTLPSQEQKPPISDNLDWNNETSRNAGDFTDSCRQRYPNSPKL